MKLVVSYRSTDRAVVTGLIDDLQTMEHQVWYDQELDGGQKWWDNILDNIRRCDALIFALTPQALDSYPCQLELAYANELRKQIIPVKLQERVNIGLLPIILQERQIVDYTQHDKTSYIRLLSALRNLPTSPPLSSPLPAPPPVPISPLAHLKTEIDSSTLTQEQQATLIHQLKGYLSKPEYYSDARELLIRLSQHPLLLASMLREIQELLAYPPPVQPAAPSEPPTAQPQPETPPELRLSADERILKEFHDIRSMREYALSSGTLTITNKRLYYTPSNLSINRPSFEIKLSEITSLEKAMTAAVVPIIRIITTSGSREIYRTALAGMSYGNREEVIAAIKDAMAESRQ